METTTTSYYRQMRIAGDVSQTRTIKLKLWREKSTISQQFNNGDKVVIKNVLVESYENNVYLNSMVDTTIEVRFTFTFIHKTEK